MDSNDIGKFIAIKRKEKLLTQKDLADKLNVSDKTISRWESGMSIPDNSVMKDLCKELDISMNELLNAGNVDSFTNSDAKKILTTSKLYERIYHLLISIFFIIIGIPFLLIVDMTYNGTFEKIWNSDKFFNGTIILAFGLVFTLMGIISFFTTSVKQIKEDLKNK